VEEIVYEDKMIRGWLVMVVLLAGVLAGCASEKEASQGSAVGQEKRVTRTPAAQLAHEKALQHFIDGSLFEMKGDYAKAVLEYQDALRYEEDHAIYFALSKCYSELNKHSLAIDAARQAVRRAPEKLEYRRMLAEVYVGAFELDAAAEQYEEIIKRDSSSIEAWFSLARLHQARKPLKALEVYESMVQRFGPEWNVLLQIAELNNSMGQFGKAADALRQMVEVDPSNPDLKRTLAQAYVRAQRYEEALPVYAELLQMNPDNLDYAAEAAAVHLLRGEYDQAGREFEKILVRDSVNVETKLRIGEVYFGQVEKDSTLLPRTRTVFERIQQEHPEDWRAYWFLGAIGALSHDDSLAVRNFRKVTELSSGNADAWVYLSSVFLEKNNFAEVVKILESAIRILPDDFRVNFFLGVAYSRVGQNVDAVKVLERARQLNSRDINVISQLALVYDGMKRYEDSDRLYEEALKIDPNNVLILNNYGYSLADRNLQLDRALAMATKAVEAQPDNSSYLDTIGWVYFRLGRYDEAERYVKQAIEKGDASSVVYEHLGDIYYRMNDRERALEQWGIALKLDENNASLREKIARGTL